MQVTTGTKSEQEMDPTPKAVRKAVRTAVFNPPQGMKSAETLERGPQLPGRLSHNAEEGEEAQVPDAALLPLAGLARRVAAKIQHAAQQVDPAGQRCRDGVPAAQRRGCVSGPAPSP